MGKGARAAAAQAGGRAVAVGGHAPGRAGAGHGRLQRGMPRAPRQGVGRAGGATGGPGEEHGHGGGPRRRPFYFPT